MRKNELSIQIADFFIDEVDIFILIHPIAYNSYNYLLTMVAVFFNISPLWLRFGMLSVVAHCQS